MTNAILMNKLKEIAKTHKVITESSFSYFPELEEIRPLFNQAIQVLDEYREKNDEQLLHYPEKELTRFYEEKLSEGPFEIENMYIAKNSSFWETIYGKEKFLPHQLSELKKQMDFTQDIVVPLTIKEFSEVIF